MMRAAGAAFLLAITIAPAAAQVSGLQMAGPRPFGVLLGDVFTLTTRLDVAPPFKLDPAALPKPGPVTYWLDLKTLKVEQEAAPGGGLRYRIDAEYQSFYAPLEAIEQTVPAFKLVVTDGEGKRVEKESGHWTFLTSPLRPVGGTAGGTAGGGSAYNLRPDATPVRKSLRPAEIAAATAGAAVVLALLLLAWTRAWPPFHQRPSRPFAVAARAVAREARAGEPGWRSAALSLHRAFDAAAGRRLLGDDLAGFLASRPAFRGLEPAIARFFAASRQAFFGGSATPPLLPADDLLRLSRELAAAERVS